MNKGIALLVVLAVTPSVYAEDHVVTAADYQATLKKYEELKPLAEKTLNHTRLLVMRAETVPEETDLGYRGQRSRALQQDFDKLKLEAVPLGDATFISPFGYCGVLPGAAQDYATAIFINDSSQFYEDHYRQMYQDCQATIDTKPRDNTGLAILDLGSE